MADEFKEVVLVDFVELEPSDRMTSVTFGFKLTDGTVTELSFPPAAFADLETIVSEVRKKLALESGLQ